MDAPTNLATSLINSSSVTLSWDAVLTADHYKVYLDDVLIDDAVAGTSFEFTLLVPDTTYTLGVSAVDALEEESTVETVEEDTDTLDAPANVLATATDRTAALLEWDAATYVDHYEVYQDGVLIDANVTDEEYDFTGLDSGTAYVLGVLTVDEAGNKSVIAEDTVTIDAVNPITDLVISNIRFTTLTATWTASAEAVSYKVYVDGSYIATTANLTYDFTGLERGRQQIIGVVAVDTDDVESVMVTAEAFTLKGKGNVLEENINEMIEEDSTTGDLRLKVDASLEVQDIQIGAVEIKNATTDDRVEVSRADASKTAATKVLVTQNIDAAGNVISSVAANSGKTASSKVTLTQPIDETGAIIKGGGASLNAEYISPVDFTVTYTSSSTITLSGLPFTLASGVNIVYIKVRNSGTNVTNIYVNGSAGYAFAYSSGVVTVYLNGVVATVFTSNDMYEVGLNGQRKAYDYSLDTQKVINQSPDRLAYVADSLVDTTNVAAADNY